MAYHGSGRSTHSRTLLAVTLLVACAVLAHAQAPVAALRAGGFVLVIRHATSPREAPAPDAAAPGNQTLERQLDARGRADATALGDALRRLKIPIETVLTSPAFRAVETVRYARLDGYTVVVDLGDNGRSMQGVTEAQAEWLRQTVARVPSTGKNVAIVTHAPNLEKAFPEWGASVAEGETVILKPDGRGRATVAGRIKIADWPSLRAD